VATQLRQFQKEKHAARDGGFVKITNRFLTFSNPIIQKTEGRLLETIPPFTPTHFLKKTD